LPCVIAAGCPNREPDIMLQKIPNHGIDGTELVKLIKDHIDDGLDLLIRIFSEQTVGRTYISNWRMIE
jgi:hypothetical protein